MFDLSLAEILLVVVVTVLCIGPKELPAVVRALVRAGQWFKGLTKEIRGFLADLAKESGVQETADDFKTEMRLIKGDDGEMYESYDLKKLPPPEGEDWGGGRLGSK